MRQRGLAPTYIRVLARIPPRMRIGARHTGEAHGVLYALERHGIMARRGEEWCIEAPQVAAACVRLVEESPSLVGLYRHRALPAVLATFPWFYGCPSAIAVAGVPTSKVNEIRRDLRNHGVIAAGHGLRPLDPDSAIWELARELMAHRSRQVAAGAPLIYMRGGECAWKTRGKGGPSFTYFGERRLDDLDEHLLGALAAHPKRPGPEIAKKIAGRIPRHLAGSSRLRDRMVLYGLADAHEELQDMLRAETWPRQTGPPVALSCEPQTQWDETQKRVWARKGVRERERFRAALAAGKRNERNLQDALLFIGAAQEAAKALVSRFPYVKPLGAHEGYPALPMALLVLMRAAQPSLSYEELVKFLAAHPELVARLGMPRYPGQKGLKNHTARYPKEAVDAAVRSLRPWQ